jgi:uncharacterized membrane protein
MTELAARTGRTAPAAAVPESGRILGLDLARSVALLAMIAFHFGRDLEVLGLLPPGTTFGGAWDWSARAIAGSFVFLAGVSLWLAHGEGLRPRAFLRRLGLLVAAAAAVSLATHLFAPAMWVRFGILHSIALGSVLALPFLRVAWPVTAAAAAALIWFAPDMRSSAFDGAWWLWSGLGTAPPPMMDYEPIVPWLAPMLRGVAFARAAGPDFWAAARARGADRSPLVRRLAWPGRHSLSVYLAHQPILIVLILAGAWLAGWR